MKSIAGLIILVSVFSVSCQLQAQSFTYQGELNQNGSPANGAFDFAFSLRTGPTFLSSAPVGDPIAMDDVVVTNGRFTVELEFPTELFDNSNRWLRTDVNGTFLAPYQKINRTPYAIQTRGINVNAFEDVGIGVDGFPQFNLGKLKVSSATRPFAIDADSSDSTFPTIFAANSGPGPVLWADGVSDVSAAGGGVIVIGNQAGVNIGIDRNEIMARDGGAAAGLLINREGGDVIVGSASGGTSKLITPVLQITGGSDLSEMFDVGGDVDVKPGMVVAIDLENPGRLVPSSIVNDRRVAGIISGAGGVTTGMRMGQQGSIADGEFPVALTGRVYCLVDASNAAVAPGDMLTTSTTRGHAMKAGDLVEAQGAIIGKAMTSLAKGESGLVLVLVNLQ